MKIAVISESPADEAAVKILVDAIVGRETELVSGARVRPGGWPHVLALLPNIVTALHYRAEADSIAVVVDSDDSPIHVLNHESAQVGDVDCRLCQLRNCIELHLGRVTPLINRKPLQSALGVAVPAIEAWYRCGLDAHVMGATWARKLLGENITYSRRSLKIDMYGSSQPSLQAEITAAVSAARRLGENIELLGQLFPIGFGCFLADIRNWQ